ncbi:MAG: hypothetical protein C0514_07760 [Candidatus Puniceispirillum sp.]|nr:hypothetical protein [Candidatus Puniceispirillum sp.]
MALCFATGYAKASLDVSDTDGRAPISPRATTEICVDVNLPAGDPIGATYVTPASVYDPQGQGHMLMLGWVRQEAHPPVWQLIITSKDAPDLGFAPVRLAFDNQGYCEGNMGPLSLYFAWRGAANICSHTRSS